MSWSLIGVKGLTVLSIYLSLSRTHSVLDNATTVKWSCVGSLFMYSLHTSAASYKTRGKLAFTKVREIVMHSYYRDGES